MTDLITPFRNHVPWTVIGVCYIICPILLYVIRCLLAAENKRRDAEPVDDTYDEVYVEVVTPEGERVERKVDKVRSNLPYSCAMNVDCGWSSLTFVSI